MKVELELSNYATKAYLKNAIDVDTLKFAKKVDSESLKPEVDKLEKVQNGLNSLKSKVDKLGVDKLVLVFVDLSKPIDVLKNDVVKQDVMYMNIIEYNAKIKDIEDKIPDITNLATYTTLNAKTKEVKNERPSITNSANNTALTAFENKIPDHSKYITTLESNKLTARLKLTTNATKGDIADFVKMSDFDDKQKKIQITKLPQINQKHLLDEMN